MQSSTSGERNGRKEKQEKRKGKVNGLSFIFQCIHVLILFCDGMFSFFWGWETEPESNTSITRAPKTLGYMTTPQVLHGALEVLVWGSATQTRKRKSYRNKTNQRCTWHYWGNLTKILSSYLVLLSILFALKNGNVLSKKRGQSFLNFN